MPGYLLIIVNYRGSTGLGQDSIDSLPGKDGTQDVGDVHVSNCVRSLIFYDYMINCFRLQSSIW